VGAQPAMEVVARGNKVTVMDHASQQRSTRTEDDPMEVAAGLSADWRPAPIEGLPTVFTGGWVGYCGYDTVRYVYSGSVTLHGCTINMAQRFVVTYLYCRVTSIDCLQGKLFSSIRPRGVPTHVACSFIEC
jgi:anthranilate/para-aminobenzoate synthase component I